MKLMICLECQDVLKVSDQGRACECGASYARGDSLGFHARVTGPCRVIAIGNASLGRALGQELQDEREGRSQPKNHRGQPLGHHFEGWVLTWNCAAWSRDDHLPERGEPPEEPPGIHQAPKKG